MSLGQKSSAEHLFSFPPLAETQSNYSEPEKPMCKGLSSIFRRPGFTSSSTAQREDESTGALLDQGDGAASPLRHKASDASNISAGTKTSRSRWPWPLRRNNTNASKMPPASDADNSRDSDPGARAQLDDFIDDLDHTFLTAGERNMLRKIEDLYHTVVRDRQPRKLHVSRGRDRRCTTREPTGVHGISGHSRRPEPHANTQHLSTANLPTSTSQSQSSDSSPESPLPRLHLRGGGRRTTLPSPPPQTRLADDTRVDATTWWFAGARKSRNGRLPTVGELRVRKEVEQANRGKVKFVGTLLGIRKIGRVKLKGEEGGGSGGRSEGAD